MLYVLYLLYIPQAPRIASFLHMLYILYVLYVLYMQYVLHMACVREYALVVTLRPDIKTLRQKIPRPEDFILKM